MNRRAIFNKKQPGIMENGMETPTRKWSPRELWTPTMTWLIALLIVKLLGFDVLWCSETSWNALLNIRLYVHVILLAFILSIPIGMFRCQWLQLAIHLATDVWCMCILFQGGGSLTRLPVMGWLLTSALPEMGTGETLSFAWYNLLLPLTTLAAFMPCLKYDEKTTIPIQGKMQYCGYLLVWSLAAYLLS